MAPLPSIADHSTASNSLLTAESPSEEAENEFEVLKDVRINSYLRRVCLVAGLSSLLFGFDTGIISSVLVSVKDDINHAQLSTYQETLVVTATTVGALASSLTAGWLSDRYGRKVVLIISGVAFTLGAVEQAASNLVKELVLGRIIVGIGLVVPALMFSIAI